MEHLSIEARVIANGRPIQFHRLAQWKTTVLLKCIHDLDTVADLSLRVRHLLLLPLSDERDSVAYSVRGAAVSCPGISDKEQYRSYLTIQRGPPLIVR